LGNFLKNFLDDHFHPATTAISLVEQLCFGHKPIFNCLPHCLANPLAIIGSISDERTKAFLAEIHNAFRPNLVVALSVYQPPYGVPALLVDRSMLEDKPTAYVCEGFVCQLPVNELEAFREQLRS
jgi:uncharacterized protein YyaL (SSP411 family)